MLRHAIVGTGNMARVHAEAFAKIPAVTLVAACDIDEAKARTFASQHEIPRIFADIDDLLCEEGCDSLSIATPDSTHKDLALRAIASGKHVLCEKPLATNGGDAASMVKAAAEMGVVNMVNFSYRASPAWQKANTIIDSGQLGEIRHFHAHYLQSWLTRLDWSQWQAHPAWLWRLSKSHGSLGALGDIGVHLIDFVTGLTGPAKRVFCHLKTFDKVSGDQLGGYHLDANDSALVSMECATGSTGTLSITRWATGHQNSVCLSVHGDQGALRIDLDKGNDAFELYRTGKEDSNEQWQTIECPSTPTNFERFVYSILSGVSDQPDFRRGAEVQAVIDTCLASSEAGEMLEVPERIPVVRRSPG